MRRVEDYTPDTAALAAQLHQAFSGGAVWEFGISRWLDKVRAQGWGYPRKHVRAALDHLVATARADAILDRRRRQRWRLRPAP